MEEDTKTISTLTSQNKDFSEELKQKGELLDVLEDHLMQVDFGVAKPKTSEELVRLFRAGPPRKPPRVTSPRSSNQVRRKSFSSNTQAAT